MEQVPCYPGLCLKMDEVFVHEWKTDDYKNMPNDNYSHHQVVLFQCFLRGPPQSDTIRVNIHFEEGNYKNNAQSLQCL